eukprot:375257-Pelagomonas_calceolata.AAC.3
MPRFNGGSSMQLAYGATHVCPPNIKGASVAATCRMKDTDGLLMFEEGKNLVYAANITSCNSVDCSVSVIAGQSGKAAVQATLQYLAILQLLPV